MATFLELIQGHASIQSWESSGPNSPVKVLSPSGLAKARKYFSKEKTRNTSLNSISVVGYVTLRKYLMGKNCRQIESDLGLRPLELQSCCYVYSLQRLPRQNEVRFRYFTSHPGGKIFDKQYDASQPSDRDIWARARTNFAEGALAYGDEDNKSFTPVIDGYVPGASDIPQWQLLFPVPVASRRVVTTTITF